MFYMCFVDLDRVTRNVLEWALRKKEIPEVLVRSVMGMRVQRQGLEWILSCKSSLRLK